MTTTLVLEPMGRQKGQPDYHIAGYPYKLRKSRPLAETELIICGYGRSGSGLFYQMLKYTVKNFQFKTFKNLSLI